jgi:2-succinyl-5-enolpyruvyl-6-hydroxy-3-cyclohexene-1-carboxylate synthase
MAPRPEDLQATFCATLVDEWARGGVEHAVVCPGSRSTPLALALMAHERLQVHVHHDERGAGFLALGLAAASENAVIVLTTSGTAAVELHPAVVEADLAGVPLLVCTADRPPELVGVGAPQSIDQTHLYGRAVRWFHAPGVAEEAAARRWRPLAARALAEATGPHPGPVHLDLPFREPLVGQAAPIPPGRGEEVEWTWRPSADGLRDPLISLADDLAGRRGVIVAGSGSGAAEPIASLAAALGWPVLAAPQAPVWCHPDTVRAVDPILRTELDLRPEVIIHLGGPLASRVTGEWLAATGAAVVVASGERSWIDPHGTAAVILPVTAEVAVESWLLGAADVEPVDGGAWRTRWLDLGHVAMAAIDEVLAAETGVTEPGVARDLLGALPVEGRLVVSSSMPIRDLEWYARPSVPLEVHANRGANGIDGVVSTAVGVALADPERACALLIGDLAFLHDVNGLVGAVERGIDLVIVVVDNDGGGIFSFLPQAGHVDPVTFERVYGTPHGLDLVAVGAAFGVESRVTDDVAAAVTQGLADGGVHVVVARTQRAANADLHQRLNAAVAVALGGAPA